MNHNAARILSIVFACALPLAREWADEEIKLPTPFD
jgi:hypothetical protein